MHAKEDTSAWLLCWFADTLAFWQPPIPKKGSALLPARKEARHECYKLPLFALLPNPVALHSRIAAVEVTRDR